MQSSLLLHVSLLAAYIFIGTGWTAEAMEDPAGSGPAFSPTSDTLTPVIDPNKRYGLADLIDLAQQINPETRYAWNQAKSAALAAGIARSTYLPRLSASVLAGTQSQHGADSAVGISASQHNRVSGSVAVLSLQWLLFDFGQRAALVDIAEQNANIADSGLTQAHQHLVHAVSVAFYDHAAARARADAAVLSLQDANAILAAAEARRARGIGTVLEIAQARQLTAQAELARVSGEGILRDAYTALLAAMGVSPLMQIDIDDVTSTPVVQADATTINAKVRQALQQRPDVLAALASQRAAEAGVRATAAELRPKLFLSASGSHGNGDMEISAVPSIGAQAPTVNLSNHRWESDVMLGVTVPLYTGGERRARLAQARNHVDAINATASRVALDAISAVVNADTHLRTSLEAIKASRTLLEASQTAYDAALASYQHGVGTITDVLTADRQLLEARIAISEADSNARSASATLALACGELGEARP